MNKVQIDYDDNITKYIEKNIEQKIDLESYIYKIVKEALKINEVFVGTVYISIYSVTKQQIQSINLKYRNIDRPTDVLSFPIFDKEEIKNLKSLDESKKLKEMELGDIILCLDVVKQHSVQYGTGLLREVLYMITHGVCHLLGYDHVEDTEKKEMRQLEEKILSNLGVFGINE